MKKELPTRAPGYPHLLLAVRSSGKPQYVIATAAHIREGRFSQIIRRGGATAYEKHALSVALDVPEDQLFK